MAQLPIVSGSEVSTPSSGVQINGAAFRQAALAPGRLAAAIGQDVGGTFQDVSQQIQQTRNTRKVFDADLSMQKAKSQFLDDINKDPGLAKDPGTWVPAYQERVQQTTESILSQPDLSPVAKRRLEMMTATWGAATTSEIRTQALRREQSDNYASGMQVATTTLNSDPPEISIPKATAAYRLLNQQGIMGPKELQARIAEAPQIAYKAKANSILTTAGDQAPRVMEQQIKGKLPAEQYRIAYNQSLQVQKRAQAENANQLSETMDDSHELDPRAKAWRDGDKITDDQYNRLVNRQKAYAKEEDVEHNRQESDAFNDAMTEAAHPPTDAKKIDAWAAEQKEAGLEWTNSAHRRTLNSYVDRQVDNVKKEGKSVEAPSVRAELNNMKEDFDRGTSFLSQPSKGDVTGGTRRVASMPDDKFAEAYPGRKRQDVIDETRARYSQKVQQFQAWANDPANKDKLADPEQVAAERKRLEAPGIEDQVKAALLAP